MNPNTLTEEQVAEKIETPAAEAPAAATPKAPKAKKEKRAAKPEVTAAKKEKKAPKAKAAVQKAEKKDRSMSGLSTAERHAKVLKAMRTLGAVKEGSAVNVARVAGKCGLGEYEVYCALWGKGLLQTEGYVKQVKTEGVRGAAFHLTAKGQKGDPE